MPPGAQSPNSPPAMTVCPQSYIGLQRGAAPPPGGEAGHSAGRLMLAPAARAPPSAEEVRPGVQKLGFHDVRPQAGSRLSGRFRLPFSYSPVIPPHRSRNPPRVAKHTDRRSLLRLSCRFWPACFSRVLRARGVGDAVMFGRRVQCGQALEEAA